MDGLPDPPRWTVRPLQGWAGSWPPLVVGRDCFDRVTVSVIVPTVCTVTVAFVPPDVSAWRRFPPHLWHHRWWGWERRWRLASRIVDDEDHLADLDDDDTSSTRDRPVPIDEETGMFLFALVVLVLAAIVAVLRQQRAAWRRQATSTTGGPRPVWPRAGDDAARRHQRALLSSRHDDRRSAGGIAARRVTPTAHLT